MPKKKKVPPVFCRESKGVRVILVNGNILLDNCIGLLYWVSTCYDGGVARMF